jgi:hypothetical protein
MRVHLPQDAPSASAGPLPSLLAQALDCPVAFVPANPGFSVGGFVAPFAISFVQVPNVTPSRFWSFTGHYLCSARAVCRRHQDGNAMSLRHAG